MKFVFCTIVISVLLIGCSGDGDENTDTLPLPDGIADDGVVQTPVSDIPFVEYTDTFISLRYPSSWILNPNGAVEGLDAQFAAPQTNALGGIDNCAFSTYFNFDPTLTLIDASETLLELFDSVPEPREEFLEVNGVPAARITGSLTVFSQQIPAIAQLMSLDGLQILGVCAGYSDEAFELILGSVTIN